MQLFKTGKQLKAARTLAGVTQETLAAECKIHQKTLQYWEGKADASGMHSTFRRRVTEALLTRGVVYVLSPAPGACLGSPKPDGDASDKDDREEVEPEPERDPSPLPGAIRDGRIYSPGEGYRTPD